MQNLLTINSDFLLKVIRAVLIIAFIINATYLAKHTFPTADEYAYIAPAYSYLETGSFKLNTEHPPLIKILSAIPIKLLVASINFPAEHKSWKTAKLFGEDGFYKEFIFRANPDKKETMLFLARTTTILLSVMLALLILRWSTELFGNKAGTLALALYTLNPNIIAYSSLMMTDIGLSLFATASIYTLWKFLRAPSVKTLAVASIVFGLAQLTKYTAVFLFAIYPAIFLAYLIAGKIKTPARFIGEEVNSRISSQNSVTSSPNKQRIYQRGTLPIIKLLCYANKRLLFCTASYAIIAVTAILIINATYGFQGTLQTAKQMFENDQNIDKTIYTPERMWPNKYMKYIAEKIPLPLPYYYVKGMGYVIVEAKSPRPGYFFGKTSTTGFWNYYLLSYLTKTPIPELILLLTSIIIFFKTKKYWNNEIMLIIPTIFYILLFSMNTKQIGLRHILQAFPLIMIFTSRIVNAEFCRKKIGKILLTTAVLAIIPELIISFPDYISYGNEIIGIQNTHLYFADPNIDLSQNTDEAISFINANPETKTSIQTTDILGEYVNYKPLQKCEKGLVLADSATINTLPEFKWLRCRTPIKQLGRTLFVYNITRCV